jgi:anti-anti-sigma factor
MSIQTKSDGNTTVVSVSGRLDAVTAPLYEKAVRQLVEGGADRVVIDMRELTYISSAGIGELLVTANLLKEKGGSFCLANVAENVGSVLEMCGIGDLLQRHASVEDALAALPK